ncbi:hypothetical protein CCACVL1_19655 [Corchorus capsularis]|uniref:RING-type E3 ubiquitin transferase n=1 Tax=Corchorus capsularis TaxID=210143 RepID=A0A1R3HFH0_COCAP|nr:hypothetical protein CCACVL1_19655 [Corchorus capsularis]
MASLEELLAEEGFRGRRSFSKARPSFRSEAVSKRDSPFSNKVKTERARSDMSRYSLREDFKGNEIVEVGVEENMRLKDSYSNEVNSLGRRGKKNDNGTSKHQLGRRSYSDKPRSSMKQRLETASDKANTGSTASHLALDEVAVQAVVSILSGYIKRFLKSEEFRAAIRHNSFSSLNFVGLEDQDDESKVILNLEQTIEMVEKAVEETVNPKELKKAALQLSVITGLNSNDLRDGFTYGVPNAMLSACAHFYLSVIYKLQKKERASAKHVMQMFCDSPFQARMHLLPELWDYLFFPHLSHLKAWYNQEADSLSDAPRRERKLELLEKVYNEIMDSGTYQLAVYYKDWLTEGVEAPPFPSIHIPSVSVRDIREEDSLAHSPELPSSSSRFTPQPMVSKKLYDAVFGRASKPGLQEAEDNYDSSIRSSDGSSVHVKQTLTFSSEAVKHPYQDNDDASFKSPQTSFFEEGISSTAEEELRLQEKDIHCTHNSSKADNTGKTIKDSDMLHAPELLNANELMLKRLAISAFEPHQSENKFDLALACLPNPSKELIHNTLENLHESYRYFDEESLFSTIPQEFICPLTGNMFEDPVTLETGQTFERVAIKEWFDQGNRTCPVTEKMLGYLSVPLTNFVLKRVIDSWKLENCRQTLALAFLIVENSRERGSSSKDEIATFILEQLLKTLSREERIMNTKHLISLGGLQFLIQRFESGNMEEKTRVAAILSCCIEADSGCRYLIAREINKHRLFELVCSKQFKSRTNAVLLLTELICLSRRKDVPLLLSDLQNEEIVNAMHALHVYLQSSPPAQRPLVATLLLNVDLLVEPQKYSLYRQEAVDIITAALNTSLIDEEVREKCCRALLILGGRFSLTGKLLTEGWILKLAGFQDGLEDNSTEKEEDLDVDDTIRLEDEEFANEEWLRNLSASLVGSGKKGFLKAICKCLGSGNLDLVTACLTTIAWFTSALSSLTDAELQLSTFRVLISQLKQSLENGAPIEHKVLASVSLFNFSKISGL